MTIAKTKYRLKFLFQQIDLQVGEFVIGRSPSCNLTLEDPLVSREHVCIRVSENSVTLQDLGSRNGTQLNNAPMTGTVTLSNNDRIRIGSHDLMFIVETNARRSFRTTGALITCPSCKVPLANGTPRCPHCNATIPTSQKCEKCGVMHHTGRSHCRSCGAAMRSADATVPINIGDHGNVDKWTSDMLFEVIEKAVQKGNYKQADKSLRKKSAEFEKNGGDMAHLSQLSTYGLLIAQHLAQMDWVEWIVDSWQKSGDIMPVEIFQAIVNLREERNLADAASHANRYLDSIIPACEPDKLSALRACLNE